MAIEEEHYKFIVSQIAARDMRPYEYLKTYVQFFTAIVGGSVWLRSQYNLQKPQLERYTLLSDAVLLLGVMVVNLLIINTFKSWHGYRMAQTQIAEAENKFFVPPPKLTAGLFTELGIMTCSILSAAGL